MLKTLPCSWIGPWVSSSGATIRFYKLPMNFCLARIKSLTLTKRRILLCKPYAEKYGYCLTAELTLSKLGARAIFRFCVAESKSGEKVIGYRDATADDPLNDVRLSVEILPGIVYSGDEDCVVPQLQAPWTFVHKDCPG